jgi:hypothetical protein
MRIDLPYHPGVSIHGQFWMRFPSFYLQQPIIAGFDGDGMSVAKRTADENLDRR